MVIKGGELEDFEKSNRFDVLSEIVFHTLNELRDLNLAIELVTKECKDEKEFFFCGIIIGKSIPFFQGLIKGEGEW